MKTQFGVDSGMVLLIDPCYLEEFAKHFNYDEMVHPTTNVESYKVTSKAFPLAEKGFIGLLHSFGGDGVFEIDSEQLRHGKT